MTYIAEFTLPAAGFPLGRIFENRPEVTLELDRVVPSGDTVMPYFWVQDPHQDLDGIWEVFNTLPELRAADLMENLGEKGLFRAEWEPEAMGVMEAIAVTEVTVLSASGSKEGWLFELRAPDADQLSEFQQYCTEHDIDVSLSRLSRLSEMTTSSEYNLTQEQYQSLLLAYYEGYYNEPREIDQASLASQLGISRQALASRLRRGYRSLIQATIASGHEHDASSR